MSNATYQTIPGLIATAKPFTHGSCRAYYEANGNYVIYSYSTLIAGITANGVKHLNGNKYSMTTSRLQNIIKRAWGVN